MSGLKRLIHEIHRRSLWQVLAIYAAASWVVLQIVDVLAQNFQLPGWFPAFALGLLILGLPIVLATAFVQEGIPSPQAQGAPTARDAARRGSRDASEAGRWLTWRNAMLGGLGALALWGMVAAAWMAFGSAPYPTSDLLLDSPSVAVLPFENMSDDEANEYFSDGLSEELRNVLAQTPGLKVAARTSAFSFKGTQTDIREIGETLGVGAVVEGSVRKSGDRVRISAQLIQVEDGFELWSDSYDRDLDDIFVVQSEIATAIADALTLELGLDAEDPEGRGLTRNLQAYDLYLIGLQRWASRSPASIREAIEFFDSAVDVDPRFALAHVGIANAYAALPFYDQTVEAQEAQQRARGAAERALELHPELGEAHAVMGFITQQYELDIATAETHFRRAVELAPNYATAHHWYGNLLACTGERERAIEQLERALALDPLSNVIVGGMAARLAEAGRDEEARVMFERLQRTPPPVDFYYPMHARLLAADDPDAAVAVLQAWAELIGYERRERLATLVRAMGDRTDREAANDVLDDIAGTTALDRLDLLPVYEFAAPIEDFLDVLDDAIRRRHHWAPWVVAYAAHRPDLATHAGFADRLGELRLPIPDAEP